MALHSLAMTRVHHMSKVTGTELTDRHMNVLEYAWRYYRKNSVGPLYQNIRRNTGVTKKELGEIFPNGLNSYTYGRIASPTCCRESTCSRSRSSSAPTCGSSSIRAPRT